MYRQQASQKAILALTALLASAALLGAPSLAQADEADDDYYEDEYAADTDEAEEAEEDAEPAEQVPARLRYARSGFYASVGGAYVFPHSRFVNSVKAEDTGAINFRIGARFQRYFALEFEYQTVPGWDLVSDFGEITTPARPEKEAIDVSSVAVNAKAYYPFGRFQPFGQIGIGVILAEAPGNDITTELELRFGGGLEFFATENIALGLTAVYTLPWGALDDYQYTSLVASVGYHF